MLLIPQVAAQRRSVTTGFETKSVLPGIDTSDAKTHLIGNRPCAICLEEVPKDPVRVACRAGHRFCRACIEEYEKKLVDSAPNGCPCGCNSKRFRCPVCRSAYHSADHEDSLRTKLSRIFGPSKTGSLWMSKGLKWEQASLPDWFLFRMGVDPYDSSAHKVAESGRRLSGAAS